MNGPGAWIQISSLLAFLVMGHGLADVPLQSDRIARETCPGRHSTLDWRWWLAAHAGVHVFFVARITGIPLSGLGEWLLQALIDLVTCRRRCTRGVDQGLPSALQAALGLPGGVRPGAEGVAAAP